MPEQPTLAQYRAEWDRLYRARERRRQRAKRVAVALYALAVVLIVARMLFLGSWALR